MNPEWRNRYELALEVTHAAAKHALGFFDGTFKVETKADMSPVTIADRESELLLRKAITKVFPDDGFLGEEFGDTAGTTGYRWIMDPIDGTRSFVRGIPVWGTLVGLEYKGELIAGVAEAPAMGQYWHALRGNGAFRGDKPIHVSDSSDLKQALVFYSGMQWFVEAGASDIFWDLCQKTDRQRGFGDFYGFVLVAQGSGEMMVEYGVHAWDVAALIPIVEEAGGRMTTWDGTSSIDRPDSLATNGKLHDKVLDILRPWKRA